MNSKTARKASLFVSSVLKGNFTCATAASVHNSHYLLNRIVPLTIHNTLQKCSFYKNNTGRAAQSNKSNEQISQGSGNEETVPPVAKHCKDLTYDPTNVDTILNYFTAKRDLSSTKQQALLTNFGLSLPFVGREDAVKQVYEHMTRNYKTFCEKSFINTTTQFPLVATIPGVGKTRLNQELPSAMLQIADAAHKTLLSSCLTIYISLGNAFKLCGVEHQHGTPDEIIGTRILYFYFLQTSSTNIDLQDFIMNVYERKQYVRLQTALQVVQRDYAMRQCQNASMIYLGIDEFQCLNTSHLHLLVSALFRCVNSISCFLYPFFSGLDYGLANKSFVRSGVLIKSIPLPLLTEEETIRIVEKWLVANGKDYNNKWRTNTKFRDLLRTVSGHARSIESILGAIAIYGMDVAQMKASVKFLLDKQMQNDFSPEMQLQVLKYVLFGDATLRSTAIGNTTVGHMEAKGLVMVNEHSKRVAFPFWFFEYIMKQNHLMQDLLAQGFKWWQEFENFALAYMSVREEVLRWYKKNQGSQNVTTVKEFFKGAKFISNNIESLQFYMPKSAVTICTSLSQFPYTIDQIRVAAKDDETYAATRVKRDWVDNTTIVKNAAGATFGDVFAIRTLVQNNKHVVFSYQCKRYTAGKPITLQNIQSEISKTNDYSNLNFRVVTVVFASSTVSNEDVYQLTNVPDLVIIDRDSADSFYGQRAYFAGLQDKLRINEWNATTMKSWCGNLGEERIEKIMAARESRPFTKIEELVPIVGEPFVQDYKNKILF